jgi:CheY-like chemotaxis protein
MQANPIDLNEIIRSFQPMIRRPLRENIDIQLHLSVNPQVILADRSKIEQIILNLAINAQDAIAGNGTIVIETGQALIDDEYAHRHPGMTPGMNSLLSFKDSGCGMADSVLQHIFEPFFTTKQLGHGTGLGLANVYGIVKQHNGYIEVQSTVGKGSCFNIYLPASAIPLPPAEQETQAAITAQACSATILLVEDNEMVREMVGQLLAGFGYRVYMEADPVKALERAQQIGRIDLLITDVVMPGMNGQQLYELLAAEHSDLGNVLYMSGYTNDVFVKDGQLQEGLHFIQKPFTVDAFMEKITAMLEES